MCESFSKCPNCGESVFHNRDQAVLEKTSLYRELEYQARTEGKNPNEFVEKLLVCPKCGHVFPINRE